MKSLRCAAALSYRCIPQKSSRLESAAIREPSMHCFLKRRSEQYVNSFISTSHGCETFNRKFVQTSSESSSREFDLRRHVSSVHLERVVQTGLTGVLLGETKVYRHQRIIRTRSDEMKITNVHLPPVWSDRSCSRPMRRGDCCWHFRPVGNESRKTSRVNKNDVSVGEIT